MGTRLLTPGALPPVESQAIYHALARSVSEGQDDTIVLTRPSRPYASLGFHRSVASVDMDYCRRNGFPVFRRRIGGGQVYLDSNQLFVQYCFGDLPKRPEQRYSRLLSPLVDVLEELRVDGGLSGGYDLTANGRKIGGIGGGEIGTADVLTTNVLFDFDWERATRIHDTPNQRFRERLQQVMERRVTTLTRELDEQPDWDRVLDIVVRTLEESFPDTYADTVTEGERALIDESIETLRDEEFLRMIDDPVEQRRIKVSDDAYLRDVTGTIDGAPVRLVVEERGGRVARVDVAEGSPAIDVGDYLRGVPIEDAVETIRGGKC